MVELVQDEAEEEEEEEEEAEEEISILIFEDYPAEPQGIEPPPMRLIKSGQKGLTIGWTSSAPAPLNGAKLTSAHKRWLKSKLNKSAEQVPEWPLCTAHYQVEMSFDHDPEGVLETTPLQLVYEGPLEKFQQGKLKPGCIYSFRIRSTISLPPPPAPKVRKVMRRKDMVNADGVYPEVKEGEARLACQRKEPIELESKWSDVYTFCTAPAVPKRPDQVNCKETTSTTICVSWSAPYNGGAEINEYCLEMDDGKGFGMTPVYNGPDLQYTVQKLQPNKSYNFRVKATNMAGSSQQSHSIALHTLASPSDPPSAPRQAPGNKHATSIKLNWGAPLRDYGNPIELYHLEMADPCDVSSFSSIYSGKHLFFTIANLAPATSYALRVRAENKAGLSKWSPVSKIKTAAAVPEVRRKLGCCVTQ
jgi:Fibronectin type III domain